MDVEATEHRVLAGMTRLLDTCRPIVISEVLYNRNEQQQQALRALVGDPDRVLSRPANLEDVFLTLTGQALEDA